MTTPRPLSHEEQSKLLKVLGEVRSLNITILAKLIAQTNVTPTPVDIRHKLENIKGEIESLHQQLDEGLQIKEIKLSEYNQYMDCIKKLSNDNNIYIYDCDNQSRQSLGTDEAVLSNCFEPVFTIIGDMPTDEKNDLINDICLGQKFNTNTIKNGLDKIVKDLDGTVCSLDEIETPRAVGLMQEVIGEIDSNPRIKPEEVADIIKAKFYNWPANYADEN